MNKTNQTLDLAQHLGKTIRAIRLENKLTIANVSDLAGISRGMLSKIENAQTTTSLDSLVSIANALGVSVSHLFRGYDNAGDSAQFVKKGQGMEVVRRGTSCGHSYHLLNYDHGPKKYFEAFFLQIHDDSEDFPDFDHPGTEFIYMLSGEMEYRHGQHTYVLQPGDSLTFDGNTPHGPGALSNFPIVFLSIIIYTDSFHES